MVFSNMIGQKRKFEKKMENTQQKDGHNSWREGEKKPTEERKNENVKIL